MHDLENEALLPVRAYWNTLAKEAPEGCRDHWVDDQGQPLHEELYDQVAAYVINSLPKMAHNNPSILEIGCGTGRILAALQTRMPGASLWGIDVSDEQIRDAQSRLKSVSLECKDLLNFVKGAGQQKIGKFDLLFAHSVTQYFPSSEYFAEVLNEATKLLRTGGVLLLVDVPVDWYYEQMRSQPRATLFTPLKKLVKRICGYKPRARPAPQSAVEVLKGKSITLPVFQGYWASPEFIERFASYNYSEFLMEYQLFAAKPVGYRKYRPIFVMRNKINGPSK